MPIKVAFVTAIVAMTAGCSRVCPPAASDQVTVKTDNICLGRRGEPARQIHDEGGLCFRMESQELANLQRDGYACERVDGFFGGDDRSVIYFCRR